MNIFCVSTSYSPAIGGAQIATHRIMQHLQARGHHVQAACFWNKRRTDWLLGTTLLAPLRPRPYVHEGVPVHQLRLSAADRLALLPWALGYYAVKPQAIAHIAALLAPQLDAIMPHADAIYCSRVGREPLAYAALRVARARRIPFMLVPHHHPRWVGWNYRALHDLYRAADGVLTQTAVERDELLALGAKAERVFVVRSSADLAPAADGARFRATHAIPPDQPLVLFLGQKYRYKGWDLLLEAAPLLWQRHPAARFVFVGPPSPASDRVFPRVRDERILELSAVSDQKKADALAACDVFCLPSSQEAFGMVYVEAWLLGKPVVALDIPALREMIDDGVDGYRVPPGDAAALAERLARLLDNPTHAAAMGAAGKRKAEERFTWAQVAAAAEHAIEATRPVRPKRINPL